jgi:hypothetical protein
MLSKTVFFHNICFYKILHIIINFVNNIFLLLFTNNFKGLFLFPNCSQNLYLNVLKREGLMMFCDKLNLAA